MAKVGGTWRCDGLDLGAGAEVADRVEDGVEDVEAVRDSVGKAAMVPAGESPSSESLGLMTRVGPTSSMWIDKSRNCVGRSSGQSVVVVIVGRATMVRSYANKDGDDVVENDRVDEEDEKATSTGSMSGWDVGIMDESHVGVLYWEVKARSVSVRAWSSDACG